MSRTLAACGICLLLGLALTSAHVLAAPCNKAAAQNIHLTIREFAQWRIEGAHLAVHWIYKIESQPEAKRLQMVTTYANMDACLTGEAREIHFYRNGKIMGIASPSTGIRLIK